VTLPPKTDELETKIARLQRAILRERGLRQEVEALLEEKTRNLYLTNQQLMEQQAARIQAEKLSALGRLSAGLAHEINNALNFIRGNLHHLNLYVKTYADLLEAYQKAVSGDPERARELQALEREKRLAYVKKDLPKVLSSMTVGTDRATAIVRDMDVFAKPEDAIAVEAIELKDPMELALVMASGRLKYKVTVTRDYGEPPRVRCHPGKVSQVFLNLLLNAADSIEEKGEIHLCFKVEGPRVIASIRDTGAGIPEASRDKVFEPFYTTKGPGKGTGLGLHMCRTIIKEHGGDIWFESEPGRGTTFFVALAIAGPEEVR
jgi:signal transduction histidine kinase